MSSLSFRGAAIGREPGIHNPQRCGVWIPGPLASLASRNDSYFNSFIKSACFSPTTCVIVHCLALLSGRQRNSRVP